jgi:hypothetical protein
MAACPGTQPVPFGGFCGDAGAARD